MTTTHLNDLFDQMEPEKGNILDKKIDVEDDVVMKDLVEKLYGLDFNKNNGYSIVVGYKYLSEIIPTTYSSDQIIKFSNIVTDKMIDETLRFGFGSFLNFLIQKSPDESHELFLSHLKSDIAYIGTSNKKNITVNGNLYFPICTLMEKGTVVINGNAQQAGFRMNGGELIVNGDSCSVAREINGGNIYHKDKLIVKDGELLDKTYTR